MGFKNIPNFKGPNYGGYVQAVSLQVNYSDSPSTLSLTIVNETGVYIFPIIGSPNTISIGAFKFNGSVQSFSFSEGVGKRILSVVFQDNSTILDQISVVLYKRGISSVIDCGEYMTYKYKTVSKTVSVPYVTLGRFADVRFEEKNITKSFSSKSMGGRPHLSDSGRSRNILVIGEEQYSSDPCSLSDSDYTFSQLMSYVPFQYNNSMGDNKFRASYEGSLRSVIQSWCADFGISFLWDSANDVLVFIDLKRGIYEIPDIQNCLITDKNTSISNEGMVSQTNLYYNMNEAKDDEEDSFNQTYYLPFTLVARNSDPFGQRLDGALRAYSDSFGMYANIYNGDYASQGMELIDEISNPPISYDNLIPGGKLLRVYYDESARTRESSDVSNFEVEYGINYQDYTIKKCDKDSSFIYKVSTTPSDVKRTAVPGGFMGTFTTTNGVWTSSQENIFGDLGGNILKDITDESLHPLFPTTLTKDQQAKTRMFYLPPQATINRIFGITIATSLGSRNYNTPIYQQDNPQTDDCQFEENNLCKNIEAQFLEESTKPVVTSYGEQDFVLEQPKDGYTNNVAPGLLVTCNGRTVEIVLPHDGPYLGYYTVEVSATQRKPSKNSDINRIEWARDDWGEDPYVKESRVTMNNSTSNLYTDNELGNFSQLLNKIGGGGGSALMKKINYTAVDFIPELPLDVTQGLETLDISLNGTDGISLQYSYSTRPPRMANINNSVRPSDSSIRRASFQ